MEVAFLMLSLPCTMPDGSNLVKVKASTNSSSGTPYCKPTDTAMAKLFIIARKPAPSLCISIKISPKDPSVYSPVRRYTLCPPTIAFCVYPLRRSGIFSRSVLMISLITTFSTIFSAMTAAFSCGVPVSRISAASSSSSINAAASGCDSFEPSR